jgi:hypothetical protein
MLKRQFDLVVVVGRAYVHVIIKENQTPGICTARGPNGGSSRYVAELTASGKARITGGDTQGNVLNEHTCIK